MALTKPVSAEDSGLGYAAGKPLERLARMWPKIVEASREIRSRTWTRVSERDLRAWLAEGGLPVAQIDALIARALKVRGHAETRIERVTDPGYRNDNGQEVVRKTAVWSVMTAQRVFAMRCTACGHRYGTPGADIAHRQCPNCQGGPAGVETPSVLA